MANIAYIFGMIGSIGILASSLILGFITFAGMMLSGLFGASVFSPGLPLYGISILITVALGIIGLVYNTKAKKGSRLGYILILIIGAIGAIGVFIPIFPAITYDLGGGSTYPAPAVTLVTSLVYIEYYFLINAGIIGLLSPKLEYTPEFEDYGINIEN